MTPFDTNDTNDTSQQKRPPFQATLSLIRKLLCAMTQATPVVVAPLSSLLFANTTANTVQEIYRNLRALLRHRQSSSVGPPFIASMQRHTGRPHSAISGRVLITPVIVWTNGLIGYATNWHRPTVT